jgi:tetratricopeptide (TPR) repeat protein
MPRTVPEAPPSAPAESRTPAADGAELRLAIGREGIGLELARPATVECFAVISLRTAFRGQRFPVDVSGGVPRFRHKRGELTHLRIELDANRLAAWASPRLRGLLSPNPPNVWIHAEPARALVCVFTDDAIEPPFAAPALGFEVHALAGEDVVFLVTAARGLNLPAAPTAIAIACMHALLGRNARRTGAAFTVTEPAKTFLQALLPPAGARMASTRGVPWTELTCRDATWALAAERGGHPVEPADGARRADELTRLVRQGDDWLVSGDEARARSAYMTALERAPRHPEIAQRVAEIDARARSREEAALGLMSASAELPGAWSFDLLRSELMARIGTRADAASAFESAGDREPIPVLASRAYELAAAHTADPQRSVGLLDRALAIRPGALGARWARAMDRLTLGRTRDAIGDLQHLDAASQRDVDRHRIWLRAGRAWQNAGRADEAAALFERALLHVPDEAEALAGLGAALVEAGSIARGTTLLSHALDMAERTSRPVGAIALDLARVLATHLSDVPAAIARASSVPTHDPQAGVARGLEGRWRARLGDVAGASLAFASLREIASARSIDDAVSASRSPTAREDIVDLLIEAADFERTARRDALSAERHLAAARRLRPNAERLPAPVPKGEGLDDAARAEKVEDLTRRFLASPGDVPIAEELARHLEALGRSHELLALLSARLDDAGPAERASLAPHVRRTLEHLAESAETAGRVDEASLYRSAIGALVAP